MSYNTEGYYKYSKETERVGAMLRSTVQDASRIFKKETIDTIFKTKKVNDKDIGEISARWAWKVVGSLKNDHEKQVKLLMIIWMFYKKGINIDDDKTWHLIWMKIGLPLFSDKINDLPATGKVAPMDSLEKPQKDEGIDIDDENW